MTILLNAPLDCLDRETFCPFCKLIAIHIPQ
jgi:hypothetical protein